MAEALVTGLMEQLGSTAAEQVKQKIMLVVGVDKEFEKLKDNLQAVVALLNEAEKKQFADQTVKDWLEKLNDVCYEMEDVVDEWNTELIKSAIQKEAEEEEENGEVWLQGLCEWEEWIGGTRGGGKEDEDCITIMPRLQKLTIRFCYELKSLPDFLRTTPLKELEIKGCPIINKRCQRETGEYWHNISHIPIIKLDDEPEDMVRHRAWQNKRFQILICGLKNDLP